MQTNARDGRNAVRVLVETSGGDLRFAGTFRTGQSGTGRQIPSQGTMATTEDGRHLAVLDVGSSTVTLFRVGGGRLTVTDRLGSGGRRPVSIASAPGNRLVVLNAGGQPNLSGFAVQGGDLVALPSLSAPLSQPNAGAYAVALSPNATTAAVSYDKAPAGKDVELVAFAGDGLGSSHSLQAVEGGGASPLRFLGEDRLLVGRMGPGVPGIATYAVDRGTLSQTSSLRDTQFDTCWIVNNVQSTRGWATFPSSVRTFALGPGGSLGAPRSRGLSGRTTDLTVGEDDRRLYVLNERGGRVRVLALHPTKLSILGSSGFMARTTTGIVDLPNNIGGF